MELLHLDLTMAELHEGLRQVRHGDTGWPYVLAEGSHVVVSDRDGEFHDGVLLWAEERADIVDGPVYHVHIGVRLPAVEAAQRLADVDMLPENRDMHELLNFIGALADEERRSWG